MPSHPADIIMKRRTGVYAQRAGRCNRIARDDLHERTRNSQGCSYGKRDERPGRSCCENDQMLVAPVEVSERIPYLMKRYVRYSKCDAPMTAIASIAI